MYYLYILRGLLLCFAPQSSPTNIKRKSSMCNLAIPTSTSGKERLIPTKTKDLSDELDYFQHTNLGKDLNEKLAIAAGSHDFYLRFFIFSVILYISYIFFYLFFKSIIRLDFIVQILMEHVFMDIVSSQVLCNAVIDMRRKQFS